MGIRSLLGLKREKRKPTATTTQPLYRTYPYLDACGQFDYERYKAAQFAANKRKIENVWAQPEDIEMLSGYIRRHIPNPRFGLCHGTRRGLEQKWFREHLKCEVVGTEISDTAMEFPNTIQWDFHETNQNGSAPATSSTLTRSITLTIPRSASMLGGPACLRMVCC
jgi:hypothetical protein